MTLAGKKNQPRPVYYPVHSYYEVGLDEDTWTVSRYNEEPQWRNANWLKVFARGLVAIMGFGGLFIFIVFARFYYMQAPAPSITWWVMAATIISGVIIWLMMKTKERMVWRMHREYYPGSRAYESD